MPALQQTKSSLSVSRAMRAPAALVLARSVIWHRMMCGCTICLHSMDRDVGSLCIAAGEENLRVAMLDETKTGST